MKSNFELEIYQQARVLSRFLDAKREQIARLGDELRSDPPRFLVIAARGTSDNAAIYAKYIFGAINRVPVALAMPSLATLYRQTPVLEGGWVIGISQSGESPDVLAVLEDARAQKVPVLAITNKAESPMAELGDHSIILDVGEEKSVAASKTYTSQLAAIAMLSAYWKNDIELIDQLGRLPALLESVLDNHEAVENVAWQFRAKEHLVVIGRGFNTCTVFETALKVKELCYIIAQAYSAADFRHGPIALLEEDFPVLVIAPSGVAMKDLEALIVEIKKRQAELAVISNEDRLLKETNLSIPLPDDLPEWLSPIVAVVPGQLLALNLALVKGYDPDKPRGLSKVTRTL